MKTTCLCAILVFVACGLGVCFEGVSQRKPTEINPNIKIIPLGGEAVQLQTEVIERAKKAKIAKPSAGGDLVLSLVQSYRLDQSTKINPRLVFGANEINYWKGKQLDRQTLKLEFAARRIILDAADEQNVPIQDQNMLSKAAGELIPLLQQVSTAPPDQKTGLNTPSLICGSRFGERSEELIKRAWDALNGGQGGMEPKNFEKALACTTVTIDSYAEDADEQQAARLQKGECKRIPSPEENERTTYFASYYALSDIAAALFIRGQVFEQQRNCTKAKEAYRIIIEKYTCAYIWDPPQKDKKGWFWSAAKGAEKSLKNLEKYGCPGIVQ